MSAPIVIESLSAVTLAVRDMDASVRFYDAMGFVKAYGGADAEFTSYRAGSGFLNLQLTADAPQSAPWGRSIFYVSDVDAQHAAALAAGYAPSTEPQDAPWGERYFHIADPDGHEVSFARPFGDHEG